jgi:hypothetical protein
MRLWNNMLYFEIINICRTKVGCEKISGNYDIDELKYYGMKYILCRTKVGCDIIIEKV